MQKLAKGTGWLVSVQRWPTLVLKCGRAQGSLRNVLEPRPTEREPTSALFLGLERRSLWKRPANRAVLRAKPVLGAGRKPRSREESANCTERVECKKVTVKTAKISQSPPGPHSPTSQCSRGPNSGANPSATAELSGAWGAGSRVLPQRHRGRGKAREPRVHPLSHSLPRPAA